MWRLLVRVVLTAVCFLYGYQLGQFYTTEQHTQLPPSCNLAATISTTTVTESLVSPVLCPETASNGNINHVFDHCTQSPYDMSKMFLQLAPSTIPVDIFPQLHHPGTPAKWAFVMTQGQHWPETKETSKPLEAACSEIYLTRTGQRQGQPNKCVAVVKVPLGIARYVYSTLILDNNTLVHNCDLNRWFSVLTQS